MRSDARRSPAAPAEARRRREHASPEPGAIRLELLFGRTLRDSEGKRVGRIKEIVAERTASDCQLRAVCVAPRRILDMLRTVTSALGAHHEPSYHRVDWRLIDASDPRHPRVRCRKNELRAEADPATALGRAHPPTD